MCFQHSSGWAMAPHCFPGKLTHQVLNDIMIALGFVSQVVCGSVDCINHYSPLNHCGVIDFAVVNAQHREIALPSGVVEGTKTHEPSAEVSSDPTPGIMLNAISFGQATAT